MEKQPIRELQGYLRLISAHYKNIPKLKPDGYFGPLTTKAVRAFQQDFGLPVTGIVDFQTWDRIYQVYLVLLYQQEPPHNMPAFPIPDGVLKQGDSGSYVALMQVMMNEIGGQVNNIKHVTEIGTYGQETENNVRAIQKISKLPETGEINALTWNAIMRTYYARIQ